MATGTTFHRLSFKAERAIGKHYRPLVPLDPLGLILQEVTMQIQTEAQVFRTVYGRLCRMSAQLLHDGYHRQAVYLAHVGKSTAGDEKLRAVNAQAGLLDGAIRSAHAAGLTTVVDLIPIAAESKAAIESEWGVRIPIVPSEVVS